MKIDLKELNGELLYDYLITARKGPEDIREAAMLIASVPLLSDDEIYRLIELVAHEGKQVVAYYPMFGNEPPKDGELIGEIIDGSLYMI